MRHYRRPVVPLGVSQEPPEGLYTLILSGRRTALSGRSHRDHVPPGQTACATPRHLDYHQVPAVRQTGRPELPGFPVSPPSCTKILKEDAIDEKEKNLLISLLCFRVFLDNLLGDCPSTEFSHTFTNRRIERRKYMIWYAADRQPLLAIDPTRL